MRRRRAVLPGFRVTMGFTVFYLCLIVLGPLLTLPAADRRRSAGIAFCEVITDPRVVASYRMTLGASLAAACVNGVFGFLVAWVLVRYEFPGPPDHRRADRSAVRAADRGRRHHPDRALCAERVARRAARGARDQGRLHAARHHDRADLHRPAVRRPHAAAGHRGSRRRGRGSGDEPRRQPRAGAACA